MCHRCPALAHDGENRNHKCEQRKLYEVQAEILIMRVRGTQEKGTMSACQNPAPKIVRGQEISI